MIEKFYAAHIKNMLDAKAINVRRSQAKKSKGQKEKLLSYIYDSPVDIEIS
ncbi:hypothetical protein [Bradyrhizobium cenepequi]|uniref:hypothetical protein n=1 Tax=Bradyrhizobium cenepequi TaxID=2821403 RepID=UPI001CE2B85E|nr:hypothetical protein [Bradyrhizobium cenepequi]